MFSFLPPVCMNPPQPNVDQFLAGRGQVKSKKPKKNNRRNRKELGEKAAKTTSAFTISDAKKHFYTIIRLTESLKAIRAQMTKELDQQEWTRRENEAEAIKVKLQMVFERLDGVTLKNLKVKVKTRERKRALQKKRREEKRSQRLKMLEHRAKLHERIDSWQREQLRVIEKEKQEQREAEEAKTVLASVTKRKSEAEKQLALLDGLLELRRVRQQAAQSERMPSADFLDKIDRLKLIWSDTLAEYKAEEKKLRAWLDERHNRERKLETAWTKALFGGTAETTSQSLSEFFAIRHAWDAFLTAEGDNEGSTIPLFWATPNASPLPAWRRYNKH